jgi:SAM-dependent methyltransferase
MNIKPYLKGIATYMPGVNKFFFKGAGGTAYARYCYSVWLRHLIMAHNNGLSTKVETIAELGPGCSLGTGLAALLCGSKKYYAFDIVEHANITENIKVFDELVNLFKKREKIPGKNEFPEIKPYLETYEFPADILTEEKLEITLNARRIDAIRNALLNLGVTINNKDIQISYFVPWTHPEIIKKESVDMIFSQAVMEHVNDLAYTYRASNRWLKPGGFMSHEIDFRSHNTAKKWNGHWAYSNFAWKLINGKRSYINRQPHSAHIDILKKNGFELVCDIRDIDNSGINRSQLASLFKNISNDDMTTCTAFIQAVKKR